MHGNENYVHGHIKGANKKVQIAFQVTPARANPLDQSAADQKDSSSIPRKYSIQ
jgi:hypothetical protein